MTEVDDSGADGRFAANVRVMREGLGWNQTEFARRLTEAGLDGFHQTTVSRIEAGARPVRLGEATLIAQTLGVPVERLVGGGEELVLLTEIQSAMARLTAARAALGAAANEYNSALVELRRSLGDPDPEGVQSDHSPWTVQYDDPWDTRSRARVLYVGWEGEDRADPRAKARRLVFASDALKMHELVNMDAAAAAAPWSMTPPF